MGKTEDYRKALQALPEWDDFLLRNSGLPGPRGNIELARAAADLARVNRIERWLKWDPEKAPVNSKEEFLAFCGVLGLGRLAAECRVKAPVQLRKYASDPRWRVREAVAMAMQRFGLSDPDRMLPIAEEWAGGKPLEQRAACAALCEPALLKDGRTVLRALAMLDRVTGAVLKRADRKSEAFIALRKGLGYCWSVAAAAAPAEGKALMEKWFACEDPDVRWIMRENLKKNRLEKTDGGWVREWSGRLAAS
jgi:hypothetical protein